MCSLWYIVVTSGRHIQGIFSCARPYGIRMFRRQNNDFALICISSK